jgi:uncharacterized protein (PEP-CTERM system associated)
MAPARRDAHPVTTAGKREGGGARSLIRFLSLIAGFSAWLACPAWALRWDIVPTLTVQETYTDNLSLTPDSSKVSDWVTQIIPGILIAGTGPRLRFKFAYALEYINYAREDQNNNVYHQLDATGTAELAKHLLFLDASANVSQSNVSLQGPLTANNVNTTGNRATVETYSVSPYLLRDFGTDLRAEARYTYTYVRSDDPTSLLNSVSDRINMRLSSVPAQHRRFTWDLSYQKETINYDDDGVLDLTSEISLASARQVITSAVALLGSAGYEDYTNTIGRASGGPSWSAGFEWAPSLRTRLIATVGQRFYGDTYFLDFRHRTRLTAWGASYSQAVTTTRNQFFIPASTSTAGYLDTLFSSRFPDPVARQKAVEEFIARTGLPPSLNTPTDVFVNQLFLQKRSNASVGLLGVRNVLIANVFRQTIEGLVGDVVLPAAPDSSIQTGTSFLWNWRITARDAWNLGAAFSRNELPNTGEISNLTYVTMGLTRQFQPRLSGALSYRLQQNDSNFNGSDYTENAVIATLRMWF